MSTLRCKFRPAPGKGRRSKPKDQPRVRVATRAARMLALAYSIEHDIEAGKILDYATVARALGVTRARLTQVLNLLLLAPEIQENVLLGEVVTERRLRPVMGEPDWANQCVVFVGTVHRRDA